MTKYIMLLLMGFIAQGCLSPEFNNPVERGTIPTLSSPSDGAAGLSVSPVLSWNAVPEEASYILQVSPDNSFSNPVYSRSGLIPASDVVSQQVTGTGYLTKYYWRVCQTNKYGTSDWSGVWSFTTTGATPGTPTLSLPNNGAADQSITPALSWNAVNGATSYNIQVATDNSFLGTSLIVNENAGNTTGRQLSGLINLKTYYWKVAAVNQYGASGWSVVYSFTTTGTAPGVPTLLLPGNGTLDQSITPMLSWNSVSNATGYNIQVATDNSFSSLVYNQSGIANTSQQVTGLNNAVTYYWRVSATNRYGTSGWSSGRSFSTINEPCPGTPTVTYSGKTYNTVQIGTQCWLKENLDVGTMINVSADQTNNGTIEKYCYNNDPSNCATYGGLYQWDEAMGYSTTAGSKGICPTGWHIPTLAEYQTLASSAGNNSNALKAAGQGTGSEAGTNTTGFSSLLVGYRDGRGYFYGLAYYAYYWSSTMYGSSESVSSMDLYNSSSIIQWNYYGGKSGFPIRCLKD